MSYVLYMISSCCLRDFPFLCRYMANSAAITAALTPSLSNTCVPHMKPDKYTTKYGASKQTCQSNQKSIISTYMHG